MKATLQILILLLGAGCACAALTKLAGIDSSTALSGSDIAVLLYAMVGSMLISLNDCSSRRPITLHVSSAKTSPF